MAELAVQSVDSRLFTVLGVANRGQGYHPTLSDRIVPVVVLPLESAEADVGGDELFADDVVDAGYAFLGPNDAGAVAGQSAMLQIFNPSASAKRTYLDAIEFDQVAGSDTIYVQRYDTALAVLKANPTNRLLGGAASTSQLRAGNNAGLLGTTIRRYQVHATANGNDNVLRFHPPLVLTEGKGVHVHFSTVNTVGSASFHLREFPA